MFMSTVISINGEEHLMDSDFFRKDEGNIIIDYFEFYGSDKNIYMLYHKEEEQYYKNKVLFTNNIKKEFLELEEKDYKEAKIPKEFINKDILKFCMENNLYICLDKLWEFSNGVKYDFSDNYMTITNNLEYYKLLNY